MLQAAQLSYAGLVAAALSSSPRLQEVVSMVYAGLSEELVATLAPAAFPPRLANLKVISPFVLQWTPRVSPDQLVSLQHLEVGSLGQAVRAVVTSLAQALPAMTNLR